MLTGFTLRRIFDRLPFTIFSVLLLGALTALFLLGAGRITMAQPAGSGTAATESQNPAPEVRATGNPGVVEINAVELGHYTQVAVVSDVHGHLLNTLALFKKAHLVDEAGHWNAGKTLLIVTGDSIDKGPASLGVLRLWIDLQRQAPEQGGRVLVLLGNHEAEFLADPNGKGKAGVLGRELAPEGLTREQLAQNGVDKQGYKLGNLLHQLPLAARVGNWLFCHAGWPPDPQRIAPDKATPVARWDEWVRLAKLQSYAGLSQETPSVAQQAPFYFLLQKKYVGEGSNLAGQDQNALKWWEDRQEVGRLLARLDQYGLTGVVFGHQPKAFGLVDSVGPYTDPTTHQPCYRLIKIDSGMGDAAYDGLQNGVLAPHAGHILLFHDLHFLMESPTAFQPAQPIPGMVSLGL